MAFFGGNTSLGATSTPAKQTGLFSSFGGPATSTPTFGATPPTTQAAPAFGTPSFGTAAPQLAAPAFGTTPAFGSTGFGTQTTATSAPTIGGFGGFGTTTTATNTGFGGFGTANTATSVAPNIFGGTGGVPTSTAAPFGGFGGITAGGGTTGGFGGFGAAVPTTTAPLFGGFGTQTAVGGGVTGGVGFGGFGTGASAFGASSNFGKPAASTVTPGFGGFGGNTNFMLGQPQQQAPQISSDEAFAQSIFNVCIYGDERDTIIAKFNYLQAMWGVGKAFYSQNAPPVEITPHNYLCRFKVIGYVRIPGKDNKMGLVSLHFNKSLTEVKNQQNQIINVLNQIFGNKPNLIINVENFKEPDEKKCQMVIYVEEKSQISPNDTKRVPAIDLSNYLNQITYKAQLTHIGVIDVWALVAPDEDQLKEYLENPPKGIDPRMWRQANLDNPDKSKFIPAPLMGFNDLKWRIKNQENEVEMHTLYIKKIQRDLSELKQRHAATTAKILEHKRNLADLSHSILKVIVKQECTRKLGSPLTAEEEALRSKLENMQALVSAPTQFKGRLSELLSQMRMQRNHYKQNGTTEYTVDKEWEDDIKSYLGVVTKAMEVLRETVIKDIKAVQIIAEGLPELLRS